MFCRILISISEKICYVSYKMYMSVIQLIVSVILLALMKKSKKVVEIFGAYGKKLYLCTRFRKGTRF